MKRKVKLAIIGAGTAGLSAYKEAQKYIDDILIIDGGPLGTTCAQVGCMPSKLLIQIAHDYHRRIDFEAHGIHGSENIHINLAKALAYVRSLRDQFTSTIIDDITSLDDRFLFGHATFNSINTLQVGNDVIEADCIIIANGSKSIVPKAWHAFENQMLTSETIFEQTTFANNLGLIGAGSIGLEFGQALSRLGMNIAVFDEHPFIGGLSDPKVNKTALHCLRQAFPIYLNEKVSLKKEQDQLYITSSENIPIDQVIVAMGRESNIHNLGLDKIGVELDEKGRPYFDSTTLQIQDYPLFIAGDTNSSRSLLHEAADEGRIAGFNAVNTVVRFKRRTPLSIIFTEPNIVITGKKYSALDTDNIAIGEVDFSEQGRAKIMNQNEGLLRIYGSKTCGTILGAEMAAPQGEHIGHLLAWSIEQKLTVFELLKMPFYHPVVEEGMRTALRNLSESVERESAPFDLALCDSEAIHSLS